MARIRSVKPELWSDEFLAEHTSRDARLLYIAMWNLADEHSRLRGGARYLKGQVFAYDDDLTAKHVDALVDELVVAKRVQRYEVDGETYLYLLKLADHQRLEPNKAASRHPEPPEIVPADPRPGDIPPSPAQIGADSPGKSSSGMEHVAGSLLPVAGSLEHGSESAPDAEALPAKPNTRGTRLAPNWQLPDTWGQWAISEGLTVEQVRREAAKFGDFWHAKAGRDATKADWAATWRTWVRRCVDDSRAGPAKALTTTSRVQAALDVAADLRRQGR